MFRPMRRAPDLVAAGAAWEERPGRTAETGVLAAPAVALGARAASAVKAGTRGSVGETVMTALTERGVLGGKRERWVPAAATVNPVSVPTARDSDGVEAEGPELPPMQPVPVQEVVAGRVANGRTRPNQQVEIRGETEALARRAMAGRQEATAFMAAEVRTTPPTD